MEKTKPVEENANFRQLIRVANTDLDGNLTVFKALTKIKGINFMLSNAICQVTNINKLTKVGSLDEASVKKIQSVLAEPLKHGLPAWIINRRSDPETGQTLHLLGGDLDFATQNDIKFMKKIRCYRGVRHQLGQPVRGQRTKSNFRKNKGKGSLGVKKSK